MLVAASGSDDDRLGHAIIKRELPPIQWRSLADGVLKSDNDTSRALIKYKTQIRENEDY